ncbi:MAG: LPS assembly lipoprotein LptE [Candidatus Hodarchaeota archaeon]
MIYENLTFKNLKFGIHLIFVICHLVLLELSCCGYSTRSLLPNYMQKVHIKIFENQTFKAGLDELATNDVIEAFRSGSNLRIVDENSADIVIEGKVSGFSKDPYTYTSNQTIIEYKISIKFHVRCVDKVKNEVFWEGSVSDWATYATDEEEAVNEAMKKTADRLVTAILTNW